MARFWAKTAAEVIRALKTDPVRGLKASQVEVRRRQYGANEIESVKKESLFDLFKEQLSNPIVLMLLVATLIAGLTGQWLESTLIIGIVAFMAVLGVYLEANAGDAIAKLKELTLPKTVVIRDGRPQEIPTKDLVVGDLIVLHEGDRVPADGRIVYTNQASLDESILTGESVPVRKQTEPVRDTEALGDQKCMVFSGTFLLEGNLRAVVVKVGVETELGKIAHQLAEATEPPTPLQIQLEKLNQVLLWGTMIVCAFIFLVASIRGQPLIQALIQSLSLAIAFIPEGLGAVMTVTLAIGVKEMVKRKVIIRRLIAAEGLGSVSLLATDKTGTITRGKMKAEKLWVTGRELDIERFQPENPIESQLVEVIRWCNNAKGATEIALVNFLEKIGFQFELEERVVEHRFSSDLKRMMVISRRGEKLIGYSKGAPEVLMPLCRKYLDYDLKKIRDLSPAKRRMINSQAEKYARQGYRVLLLAKREFADGSVVGDRRRDENDLVFIGLIGLMDPVRSEVQPTVEELLAAGVRPVLVTGDHPEIARTIALAAGIVNGADQKVITGKDLDMYFNHRGKLRAKDIISASVFARVNPSHKNQLIEIFSRHGEVVAMAGDGINDAVAIARADIGIAVRGVDIAREAADVIVTGGYDALANAVRVGRAVIQRTRLYLHYILSGNFCEVGVFILAIAAGLPMPLTAISLLIINLLTDAAPAMAMAFEKEEPGLMTQPPRPKTEGMINRAIWQSIILQGIFSSIFLFLVFLLTLPRGLAFAQTATFSAYIFQKIFRAFTARSFRRSVFEYGFFTNRYSLLAVCLALAVWAAVVYLAGEIFGFVPLDSQTLVGLVAASLFFPAFEELLKLGRRRPAAGLAHFLASTPVQR